MMSFCEVLCRAGMPCRCPRLGVVLSVAAVTVLFGVPSAALAHFTRRLICDVSSHVSAPRNVAVDGEDHLWASEILPNKSLSGPSQGPSKFYEFGAAYSSCGGFLRSLEIEGRTYPHSVAINRGTGDFYVTGPSRESSEGYLEVFDKDGQLVKRWANRFGNEIWLALDNSTEPIADPSACGTSPLLSSECVVYVAHGDDPKAPFGDGAPTGLGKFASGEKPVTFGGTASYIKGNQITGTSTEPFIGSRPEATTVDPEGNIYTVNGSAMIGESAVDEFSPTGVFLHAFTGEETPGLGGNREKDGFGGSLQGVTYDPVSGHVIVAVKGNALVTQDEGVVDEYEAATGRFVETELEARLDQPTEITVDSRGDLYVLDKMPQESVIHVFGPGHFLPSLKLDEATERKSNSAVLQGSVNPEGLELSDCHFEYVSESAFVRTGFSNLETGGQVACTPAADAIATDKAYHAVHAEVTNLVSGTTYRYRLVATSSGELGGTEESGALAVTALHAPRIDSVSAGNISSTSAVLKALIGPLGAATTYQFEYANDADYRPTAKDPYEGGARAPAVPTGIGSGGPSGNADALVVQQLADLAPDTTYHFRVVAKNEVGTIAGVICGGEFHPDCTFTTLPARTAGLPDDRAYELVTPASKSGGGDMFGLPVANGEPKNNDVGYSSESGDSFLLETFSAFGPFPAAFKNVYTLVRDMNGGGWQAAALAEPTLGVQSINAPVFAPNDLSHVAFNDLVGSTASESGAQMMNLVGSPGGPYTVLNVDPLGHENGATATVAASHDLRHVVLESTRHTLCPGAERQVPESAELCMWTGGFETLGEEVKPELKLVNVDSRGALVNPCGAVLGQGRLPGAAHNAVSAGGSKIFFTAPDPRPESGNGCWKGGTSEAPQLYLRSGGVTIRLSSTKEKVVDPTGQHPATYVGASEDGSKVFFVSETWLTKNHPEKNHDPELYEYDTDANVLTRVSVGEATSQGAKAGAQVHTVPAVSADGSAVYFTAFARLTTDAAPQAPGGEKVDLYRYDTTTSALVYVTTVKAPYARGYQTNGRGFPAPDEEPNALIPPANWYTTPDGRYLLFATPEQLTGYSTTGSCVSHEDADARVGQCEEVYRYDATAAEGHGPSIVCISCNPSGALPESDAQFARSAPVDRAAGPVRAMSDDGSYVFFDTSDALVTQDGNGTLDVYEWHNGNISLIGSGNDRAPSFFLGASPDGSNVFFGTHARLVPQDVDTNGDLYDARICTVVDPCIKESRGETSECEGATCQTVPVVPIDATPGSLTFTGPGNVLPASSIRKPRSLTSAHQLARALRACRRELRHKRAACEAQAKKRYGGKPRAGRKARRSVRGSRVKKSGRGGK